MFWLGLFIGSAAGVVIASLLAANQRSPRPANESPENCYDMK